MDHLATDVAMYRFIITCVLATVGGVAVLFGYLLFSRGSGLFKSIDKLAIKGRDFSVSVSGMTAGAVLMGTSIGWGYWSYSSVPRLEMAGDNVKVSRPAQPAAQTQTTDSAPSRPPQEHNSTTATHSTAERRPSPTSQENPPPSNAQKPQERDIELAAIPEQKPDQWLASRFKGTSVVTENDEKIGDVSDILFDRDGTIIRAYVVSVGGFIGIGSQEVAFSPDQFRVMLADDRGPPKLKVRWTKDQLYALRSFRPYKNPAETSSTTTGGTPR
jgi:sporulation protein YlmC with PRC-barrel domain